MLDRLSRVTTSGSFVPQIDGLRFVAIIGVVFYHSLRGFFAPNPDPANGGWDLLVSVFTTGWFGVQLFFIISGFILSTPFAQGAIDHARPVSLKKYYLRRVTRLEPPYIINLTISALLLHVINMMPLSQILPHYLANITYTHNFLFSELSPINFVTWTLEIEIQFYILAPLLSKVFRLRKIPRRLVLVAGILIPTALSRFIYSYGPFAFLGHTLFNQIQYFLVGFLLADMYVSSWRDKPARLWRWDIIGGLAWLAVPLLLNDRLAPAIWPWAIDAIHANPVLSFLPACKWVAMPFVLLLAYIAAFRGHILKAFFSNAWIALIGGMCYTIYLYHYAIIYWLTHGPLASFTVGSLPFDDQASPSVSHNVPWCLLQMLYLSLLVIIACAVLFAFLEKPFMRKDWPAKLAGGVRHLLGLLRPRMPQKYKIAQPMPLRDPQPELVTSQPERQRD